MEPPTLSAMLQELRRNVYSQRALSMEMRHRQFAHLVLAASTNAVLDD